MYILGISCFYHDAAAALIQDGVLVSAAEEERFSRKKHDYGFPRRAISFCLRQAGITSRDLDYVVFYEKPLVKFERILMSLLGTFPCSWNTFGEAMIAWFSEKLWIKSLLMSEVGVEADQVLFVEHHLSHAASAFFCSPYKEAAILTVDGIGEWTTAAMGRGTAAWNGEGKNAIILAREQRFPHSIGLLYSAFTAWLGFKVNNGEYKVMGMSSYGTPRYLDKVYQILHVEDDGSFWLDMDYFSYHYSPEQSFGSKFVALFGEPRRPESEFLTQLTNPEVDPGDSGIRANQHYADVAASIQRATEETLLKMANQLYRETGLKQLCMAGGVAFNSVANGRILRETPFEEIFIQPAAGDSGGALGAALYVYHVLLGYPRRFTLDHAYWGQGYSNEEIRAFLDANHVPYDYFADDGRLVARIVDELVVGKVVGFFQGRFEWGPRALGNRSILADPRRAGMKQIVNDKIKFRESFRPFAPVVLEERCTDYFDLGQPERHQPARYMLYVVPILQDKWDVIPAVTHQGGTGRLQTIRRETNPRYYRVVELFGEATGVPVLLNTSFNLRGEPIVNTPADAFNTFRNSGLDTLVLGPYLIEKAWIGQGGV